MWGIVPAAGQGTRIQPLAFSKELLPVGSRIDAQGVERPRAVCEYLLDRMVAAGADRICFVISPGKSDIPRYFGGAFATADLLYAVQDEPNGLCDALFRAAPVVVGERPVLIGLPDTIWFPETGFAQLPNDRFSLLLFPVDRPELFDAVVLAPDSSVREILVKSSAPPSSWIWGAMKIPGRVYHDLHTLWRRRDRKDQYFGALVNAYIADGGKAWGVCGGENYVDVGTLHGYREATALVGEAPRRSEMRPGLARPCHRLGRSKDHQ